MRSGAPVLALITASLAALGLTPAAFSHAIGSETQRPFALVIVGGVFLATPLLLFALPTLYRWIEAGDRRDVPFARSNERDPREET